MSNFIVVGAGGFLGTEISRYFSRSDSVVCLSGMANRELKIRYVSSNKVIQLPLSYSTIESTIKDTNPAMIVNCSGLVGDDKCSVNPQEALWANVEFVTWLAKVSGAERIPFIHFSSDAVFGNAVIDRIESDKPIPKTIYGETKLKGELAALEYGDRTLIIRTNFYGFSGGLQRGLFDFYLDNLQKGLPVEGYANVLFNPVLVQELPRFLESAYKENLQGVIHISGNELLSKYRFGCLIADCIGANQDLVIKHFFSEAQYLSQRNLMYLNSTRKGDYHHYFSDVIRGIEMSYNRAMGFGRAIV